MVDFAPLEEAWLATTCEGERKLIDSLMESLRTGSPFPRRLYDSDEAEFCVSDLTYKALGQVLRSINDEDERARREKQLEGTSRKALDFSKEVLPTPLAEYVGSSAPNRGGKAKSPRSPVKIRATRKAARIALHRIRGTKPSTEVIEISSDDDERETCFGGMFVRVKDGWENVNYRGGDDVAAASGGPSDGAGDGQVAPAPTPSAAAGDAKHEVQPSDTI